LAKIHGRRTGPTKATRDVVELIVSLVKHEASMTSVETAKVVASELGVELYR
jgi:hypothetical protein